MAKAETKRIEQTGAHILGGIVDIKCDIIIEAGNIRKADGKDPSIKSLADNMRAVGQLVPIIVRPLADLAKYELIAGHRRLAACRLVGIETLKAIVVEATDEQAQTIAITENMQRENLTPLEEAAAIKNLLDTGMSEKATAAVLGWTIQKVVRRAKLLNLIPEFLKKIESDKNCEDWGPAHMELIARFDPGVQRQMLKEMTKRWVWVPHELDHLERFVGGFMHLLSKAAWKLDDASLNPKMGACTSCPHRSSNHPGLFDDDLTEKKITTDDRCLNVGCWNAKAEEFTKRRIAEFKGEDPKAILVNSAYKQYGEKKPAGIFLRDDYYDAKKGDQGAVRALIIDGEEKGTFKYIQFIRQPKKARAKDEKGITNPAPLADRKKRLQDRRNAHIVAAIREILSSKKVADKILLNNSKDCNRNQFTLAVVAAFGTSKNRASHYDDGNPWKKLDEFAAGTPGELIENITRQVAPVLHDRLLFTTCEDATMRIDEAKSICQLMSIDFEGLQKKAEGDIPIPKSWAKIDGEKKPEKPKPGSAKAKSYRPPPAKVKKTVKRKSLVHAKGK